MIYKHYEFVCNTCGMADYPNARNKKYAIKEYRRLKGIVTKELKVYCNKVCYLGRVK